MIVYMLQQHICVMHLISQLTLKVAARMTADNHVQFIRASDGTAASDCDNMHVAMPGPKGVFRGRQTSSYISTLEGMVMQMLVQPYRA